MTELLNPQSSFWSYTGSITGALGLGTLQANPYLTSVWINYQSPYASARFPQGSFGFSANLNRAVTTVLGKSAGVYSKQGPRRSRVPLEFVPCGLIPPPAPAP